MLGFQAPNITEVETASPTLSKLSKHMILSLAANLGYRIKSGDITSAFLQAKANLEKDELTIWAPPELAVLYGAPPERPIMPLRIVRAFYGLVQSPRLWFEDLQSTMLEQGWKQVTADKCAFILLHEGELVGLAGVHVDDYLIAGKQGDPVFEKAEKALRDSYNFGKWESDSFEFAGTFPTARPRRNSSSRPARLCNEMVGRDRLGQESTHSEEISFESRRNLNGPSSPWHFVVEGYPKCTAVPG